MQSAPQGRARGASEFRPGRASAEGCLRRPLVALSGSGRRKAALTKLSAWMDDVLGSHLGAYRQATLRHCAGLPLA
jgi:hypothetical protein